MHFRSQVMYLMISSLYFLKSLKVDLRHFELPKSFIPTHGRCNPKLKIDMGMYGNTPDLNSGGAD